jgi:protein TonB
LPKTIVNPNRTAANRGDADVLLERRGARAPVAARATASRQRQLPFDAAAAAPAKSTAPGPAAKRAGKAAAQSIAHAPSAAGTRSAPRSATARNAAPPVAAGSAATRVVVGSVPPAAAGRSDGSTHDGAPTGATPAAARGAAPAVADAAGNADPAPRPRMSNEPHGMSLHHATANVIARAPASVWRVRTIDRWLPRRRKSRWIIAGSPLLTAMLAVSIVVHLVVLSIHFQSELKRMIDRGPTLEVAIVNAKSDTRPTQPDILAQANLEGGGNTDADRKAKTPLPVLPRQLVAQQEMATATEEIEAMEKRATELMTQLRNTPMPSFTVSAPEQTSERAADVPTAAELTQRALESMRLEAQVAKEMDAYQKRPKRRFVGARAEEYRFARYVEDWRLKVERIGNLNYPEAARQMKLYGSLILSVSIRADGSLESVEITRSSGQRVLDAAAVRIVEMAAPYAPLPSDVQRDTDVLVITRTWSFTRGEELKSE